MSNTLTYQFIPINTEFKKIMLQAKLTLREYKVLDGISCLAYSYPETRENLTVKTTCRQIGDFINMPFQHVSSALNKLSLKGFISIIQKGLWQGNKEHEPSIIQLNRVTKLVTQDNINNDDRVTKMVTHRVTKSVTPPSNQIGDTPKEISKKRYQESSLLPSPSPDDDVIAIDKREEEKTDIEKILKAIEEWEQEEEPLNHSSNCLPPAAVNQISSKQNPINPLFSSIPANFINTVDNSKIEKAIDIKPVSPAPTAPVTIQGNRFEQKENMKSTVPEQYANGTRTVREQEKIHPLASSRVQAPPAPVPQVRGNSPADKKDKEFSPLGDILPGSFKLDTSKYSATVPGILGVSADTMIKGKIILIEKNLTEKEINMVFDRVSKAITAGNVDEWKRNKYVLNACTNEQERTPAPEKSLDEKEREKFIEKVNSDFRTGKVKYVLSNEGEKQPIIEMDYKGFIYWKGRRQSGAIFKELPSRLLDMRFFVGD